VFIINLDLKSNKSFTLIELVIVLSILAILASAAVSTFVDIANKAFDVQERQTMSSLKSGALLYYAKNNSWWGTITTQDPFVLLENPPVHVISPTSPKENIDWYLQPWIGTQWLIMCPHAFYPCPGPNPNCKGKKWTFDTKNANLVCTQDLPHR
jgi:prepilin-type N-terminal cleavage/methylation domain-containing protein